MLITNELNSLLSRRWMRLSWYLLVLVGVVHEVVAFVRLRRQHVQFFYSRRELFLLTVLVAVMLLGIFVKSRQNHQPRSGDIRKPSA